MVAVQALGNNRVARSPASSGTLVPGIQTMNYPGAPGIDCNVLLRAPMRTLLNTRQQLYVMLPLKLRNMPCGTKSQYDLAVPAPRQPARPLIDATPLPMAATRYVPFYQMVCCSTGRAEFFLSDGALPSYWTNYALALLEQSYQMVIFWSLLSLSQALRVRPHHLLRPSFLDRSSPSMTIYNGRTLFLPLFYLVAAAPSDMTKLR